MNIRDVVQNVVSKRALYREKLREEKREKVYKAIPEIENLIKERDRLAIGIVKNIFSNGDLDREKFQKLDTQIRDLLLKNNFKEDEFSFKFLCEKCKDTGFVNSTPCSCVYEELSREILFESGITDAMRVKNFENFKYNLFEGNFEIDGKLQNSNEYIKSLVNFSKDYCDKIEKSTYGLYFYGNSGVGKTYFATAMVNYLLDNNKRAMFITATDFFDLINTYSYSFSNEKKELKEKIDLLKDIDFLVIDDLGSEISYKQNNSFLSTVLDSRIDKKLATVITSNLSKYDLADHYDTRISSRINGYFKFFKFPTRDIRGKV